ncbi:hypothetical protein MKW92_020396, partial [Papaver armeniacum]
MGSSHVLVRCFIFFLLKLQAASVDIPTNAYRPITKPGCQDHWNVSIPYPFGIGEGCFIGDHFKLACRNSSSYFTMPTYGGFIISNISISDGHMRTSVPVVSDCSDKKMETYNSFMARLSKFTFSNTKNRFIAIGCDTKAYLGRDNRGYIGTGCMSVCNATTDIPDKSCNGIGCCKASIPSGLGIYNTTVTSMGDTRRSLSFNPCSYAFLVEESWFKQVPVVVDWTVGYETCGEARRNLTTYACGPNTNCISSKIPSVQGYRCYCKNGYEGNPYLNGSTGGYCQGTERNICINTDGGYRCPCKQGFDSQNEEKGVSDCIPHLNLYQQGKDNSKRIVV